MFKRIAGKYGTLGLLITMAFIFTRCHDTIEVHNPGKDLSSIPFNPVLYSPLVPDDFPALEQPADNLMTIDGLHLGRKLFYDPILSVDSTISCASCHQPAGSFTDGLASSVGVGGHTSRSSMSLINIGFHYHGLFWDGRSASLEEQALVPVEDPLEMGEQWSRVVEKLQRHESYPGEFRKAFGIENSADITKELAAKAIAQFERSLISGGNTRYDRFARGEIFLDENEYNGFLMFFDFEPTLPDAECGHCHNAPLFATSDYFNNGLQESADFQSFQDKGLGLVTGKASDNGKFKAPSLRNIVFSAPYMHDGRFQTLNEVVDHYSSGGKNSPTKSPLLYPLHLTQSQKADLISFILTLTDSSSLTNEAFQNPF
jgi:cytochrome c peroxidase